MPISPAQARALRDTEVRLKRAEYALSRLKDEDSETRTREIAQEFIDARRARVAAEQAADRAR